MSKFLGESFKNLEAYVPGEQPRDKKYIKLNTNESPYPPSQGVIDAINEKEIKDLRLYSDPTAKELKEEIAKLYGVRSENVFVSNGSDEILNFSFMAFGKKGVSYPDITYGFYKVFAELYNLDSLVIPLTKDFKVDSDKFKNLDKMVVIANPNAPTGLTISLKEIEEILITNRENIVLIDEAYVDFGGESAVKLVEKYNNLIVCQTFSKSRSLAGARLGFAIADEEIIKDLEKIKYSTNPYNINRLTLRAGTVAIKENNYYNLNTKKITETREYVRKELLKLNFDVLPSKANFLFAKSDRISGKDFYDKLRDKGILVRHFETERIKDFNRITIGSYEEMEEFIKITKEILGEEK